MGLFGSTDVGSQATAQNAQQQQQVNQAVGNINSAFSGFTPKFYQQRGQAYEDAALPQVGQQFQQTNQETQEALANRGLGKSGAADQANASLQQQLAGSTNQVANQAQQAQQSLQEQVVNEQSSLIGQAQSAANPATVAGQAIAQAGSLQAPSVLAPIGNMFQQWANTWLAGKLNNAYSTPATQGGTVLPTGAATGANSIMSLSNQGGDGGGGSSSGGGNYNVNG